MTRVRLAGYLARAQARVRSFVADERGSAVMEYAALCGVSATGAYLVERYVGERVAQTLMQVADALRG